jgi:thiamine biosynthesis protein ThiS
MNLMVNGSSYEHRGDGSVPALLAELGATPEHTALTVNGELVPSKHPVAPKPGEGGWKNCKLNDGDTVEVLTFVGGG